MINGMNNNARLGFTFQAVICNRYNIIPSTDRAINTFNSAYDSTLESEINALLDDIFSNLKVYPIECTTFKKKESSNGEVPYNFVLSDNSTLSIRTNLSGGMVAPREVGQAGYEKLNKYFSDVYGKEIQSQNDIKSLFLLHVDKVLPVFFDFLFDADYILWIFLEGTQYKYKLINGDLGVNISYIRDNFSFTRDGDDWLESTTLKYKGVSIAEIQVHKNRTFKLRFKMKNILPLIFEKQINNETLGITAEKTVCDIFGLKYPSNFFNRYSTEMQYQLTDVISAAFKYLPIPIKHCGSMVGERGGNSKSSYDFILKGNKTLSLKTNIGKKVCPPEVGQPNDKTCYVYFKQFVKEKFINKINFKEMIYNHIDKILPIYLSHMFDSDYLLRIYENNKKDVLLTGYVYGFDIVNKDFGKDFVWEREKITFSQPTIDLWNESNTVYYSGISLGEFQVHNNRNCFKFRFNFDNLVKILKEKV